jgi:hypothetical protein
MSDLVLVAATDSKAKRLAEFRLGARTIAALWGESTRIVAVDSGSEISRAPALRRWRLGHLGESVLDGRLGAGAYLVRARRREWIEWCEEVEGGATHAEMVLAGV